MLLRPSWLDSLASATLVALSACALLAGCATGPAALQQTRLHYNEVVKSTTEQQLLLNIVRLRYGDTPSSLSIANIAAQFELVRQLQLTPFFTSAGADVSRSYSTVLPQAGVSYADRPTFSLVPIDDAEFTRKLFTPLTLEGVLYLAKTTWPIGTVFRLYLENLNWVSNAELASGPTPGVAPKYSDFLLGVLALQNLQQQSRIVFATEERFEPVGGPVAASQMNAANVLEAAKNGLEFRPDAGGATLMLGRRVRQPVLYLDPSTIQSGDAREFVRVFGLKPGLTKYDITVDSLRPFADQTGSSGLETLDLETRSLLQAMYFVSHGVEVPPEHLARRIARTTIDDDGNVFDWRKVTQGLFRVQWSRGDAPPASAHAAVFFQGYWFYIDEADHDSKSTFSLLMELTRLDLQNKPGDRPVLTLPISR